MYLTKGAPRALIDAFSAHNRGGDERSTSPSGVWTRGLTLADINKGENLTSAMFYQLFCY
jgi:hypothetical protein